MELKVGEAMQWLHQQLPLVESCTDSALLEKEFGPTKGGVKAHNHQPTQVKKTKKKDDYVYYT